MLLLVQVSGSILQQQGVSSPVRNIIGSGPLKHNQQREGSGRIIRSILINKDSRQSQSFVGQSEQQIQTSNSEKDKRPPRIPHAQLALKDTNSTPENKVVANEFPGFYSEKQEKRSRNKDKPDRGVWAPLRRSDGTHASEESLSSGTSQLLLDSSEGTNIWNM